MSLCKKSFALRFYGFCERCLCGVRTEARACFDRLSPNGGGERRLSPFALSLSKGGGEQSRDFDRAFRPELS
jgi:hypothetical protein